MTEGTLGMADGKRAAVQGMREQGGGWFVIALFCVSLSWSFWRESGIPVSIWHVLKMDCEKQMLLKIGTFVFFETKKRLIDRNKFIALMYSRELLDRHWLHESLSQSSFLAKDGNFLKHQCSAMAVEHLLSVSQAEFPNLLYGLWWRNIRGQEVSPATLRFSDKSWHHW